MASTKLDPEIVAHLEWLGFVRPTGLVVSAPALVRAGAILDRRDAEGQRLLRACVEKRTFDPKEGPGSCVVDFRRFAEAVLEWTFSPKGYAGIPECPIPTELEVPLQEYDETLRPDFAVRELEPKDDAPSWQLLVRVLEPGEDFDRVSRDHGQLEASPHGRMERLLRATRVPAGVLFNSRALRVVSAPRGESSGWLDFRVADMVQTAGRPISTAMRLLLGQPRLLALPRGQRLAALLEDSRKFQNEVSERLAEQVLHALYEFLRGFQAAHDASKGQLLREPLTQHPDEVYRALLTVILRLVFLLYAEERDMLPEDEVFLRHYSLGGLYDRLREDSALFPDTMDQRFGAWGQLLVLFRMIHDGAEAGTMRLPKRHGVLFDPDRFTFLEGRPSAGVRTGHSRIDLPLVPDGTIYRALEKLLILDGERISYRALDVEQIGSVYETMMGFRLETATGRSIAVKAQKKQGAPTALDLESLLTVPAAKREKWVQDRADRKLSESVKKAVVAAASVEDLHAALLPVSDLAATPDLVSKGAMVLQPSEERRRSGSHYTPRTLTEPIVRTTLEPILSQLRSAEGRPPTPAQILGLKVCDPAMGSGAFLVEACRQLGDALIESWRAYGETPEIPTDEDEVIFARRLIAQRCLYGLDRNPVAVDLAKVSLWLATLAKDHALTFMDHALRHGDSLLGLSRKEIEAFHWTPDAPTFNAGFETMRVREHIARVAELRNRIRRSDESVSDRELHSVWEEVLLNLRSVRLFGDLAVMAFFEVQNPQERELKRSKYANAIISGDTAQYAGLVEGRRNGDPPLAPLHWEIEFPEVFEQEKPGFDAIIGNPPFAGRTMITTTNVSGYLAWLQEIHTESHGNADLVAHFFRRAFHLIRAGGAFGLIATNTIAQGDTRSTELRWLCQHGGEIFAVRKRVKWPGLAAVVVSVVHVMKGSFPGHKRLEGHDVKTITAFLFHSGGHDDPTQLQTNALKSFQGYVVVGMGFTFDDTDKEGVATPVAEMRHLLVKGAHNQEVIFPYIGGEEVNTSPTHSHHRHIINFGERSELECRQRWPDLMAIVEQKVRPEREASLAQSWSKDKEKRARNWWQFSRTAKDLQAAIAGLKRILVTPQTSNVQAFAFLPPAMVYAHTLIVFPFANYSCFAVLQSRIHQIWSAFFGPTMKDDLRYTPSDCFETFPLPENWEAHPALEAVGKAYYEFRAALMMHNQEGLTRTYNRFHDPELDKRGPGIDELWKLHDAMDRAVLNVYGWGDIKTACNFLLDYPIDEEEWGKKRKPWRYRWPDDVRDEVLARLLELNAQRTKDEALAGLPATKKKTSTVKKGLTQPDTQDLLS
jgi:hypothetical protein